MCLTWYERKRIFIPFFLLSTHTILVQSATKDEMVRKLKNQLNQAETLSDKLTDEVRNIRPLRTSSPIKDEKIKNRYLRDMDMYKNRYS